MKTNIRLQENQHQAANNHGGDGPCLVTVYSLIVVSTHIQFPIWEIV